MLILQRVGMIILTGFSLPLWALSGSIIDPALSSVTEKTEAVSLKLKVSRSLRQSSEEVLNISDTLSISTDLTVSAPVRQVSYFERHEFLNNKSFLAVLSYSSPVLYNESKIKRDHCWQSVFCIKNLSWVF